jgi:hypothetical protein
MKEFLYNSREFVRSVATRVGKAINPPLSADATPLDIQHAIIEAIEARTQPIGAGRRGLPDRLVRVRVLAQDAAHERALHLVLAGIRDKALARLRELSCEVPDGFQIEVACVRRRPAAWAPDQPMHIEYVEDAGQTRPEATGAFDSQPPGLTLTILRGRATASAYALQESVVRIGRSETPVDHRGHARLNHVPFTEEDDPHSRTVGRGHCEIRYDSAGRSYRIFDERSANGTRIIRDGQVIEVPPQDPFGVAIRSGDVLEFGTAAARVEIAGS